MQGDLASLILRYGTILEFHAVEAWCKSQGFIESLSFSLQSFISLEGLWSWGEKSGSGLLRWDELSRVRKSPVAETVQTLPHVLLLDPHVPTSNALGLNKVADLWPVKCARKWLESLPSFRTPGVNLYLSPRLTQQPWMLHDGRATWFILGFNLVQNKSLLCLTIYSFFFFWLLLFCYWSRARCTLTFLLIYQIPIWGWLGVGDGRWGEADSEKRFL